MQKAYNKSWYYILLDKLYKRYMKKLSLVLGLSILLSSCGEEATLVRKGNISWNSPEIAIPKVEQKEDKLEKGIWWHNLGSNFRKDKTWTRKVISNLANEGFTDIYYQVYPNGQMLTMMLGTVLHESNKHNIKVHVWINPFRNNTHGEYTTIKAPNWTKSQDWGHPTDPKVREGLFSDVRELLKRYKPYPALGDLHIDDYFYPYSHTIQKGVSSKEKEQGVFETVAGLHALAEEYDMGFTVSPLGIPLIDSKVPSDIKGKNIKEVLHFDAERVAQIEGINFIPQLYWPTNDKDRPLSKLIEYWQGNYPMKSIGIAAHRYDKKVLEEQTKMANEAGLGVVWFVGDVEKLE